jgi:hypothetical protein
MAGADTARTQIPRPALAATYEGGHPALLERIAPLVDFLEISPDSIARADGRRATLRPEAVDEFRSVSSTARFVAHGVGLSIGSFDCWNESYLHLLDELFERLPLDWHSEHLAFTTVAGENLGTMLALPRTTEALDLVSERVLKMQRRYGVPFLLEHVIELVPNPGGDYSAAGFLNALTARTGCGLILDAYNLECDRLNRGFDVSDFLEELDLTPVRELHVAGGARHKGFQMDIHSRTTADPTLSLALDIIARAPDLRLVTFEFLKEALPTLGHDAVCGELARIRKAIAQ